MRVKIVSLTFAVVAIVAIVHWSGGWLGVGDRSSHCAQRQGQSEESVCALHCEFDWNNEMVRDSTTVVRLQSVEVLEELLRLFVDDLIPLPVDVVFIYVSCNLVYTVGDKVSHPSTSWNSRRCRANTSRQSFSRIA